MIWIWFFAIILVGYSLYIPAQELSFSTDKARAAFHGERSDGKLYLGYDAGAVYGFRRGGLCPMLYFPRQKREKIPSRMSSAVTSPIISEIRAIACCPS